MAVSAAAVVSEKRAGITAVRRRRRRRRRLLVVVVLMIAVVAVATQRLSRTATTTRRVAATTARALSRVAAFNARRSRQSPPATAGAAPVPAAQSLKLLTNSWAPLLAPPQGFRRFVSDGEPEGISEEGEDDDDSASFNTPTMQNLYREWTVEDDKLLWDNHRRRKSTAELASMLGRGLRGVESRLAKLKDVDSPAYERLFVESRAPADGDEDGRDQSGSSEKLVPVSEVLRRIQWDYSLPSEDFSILHYDRVDDTIVESSFTEPNTSINGPKELLVDALPEHRIVAVKYRERVVWDRAKKLDLVFSNEGIASVIEGYAEWKRKRDDEIERNRRIQQEVARRIERILGYERFKVFQELSSWLLATAKDLTVPPKVDVEKFVRQSLDMFRQAREDPSAVIGQVEIPRSDYEALDTLSELVALLPEDNLRPMILSEISLAMKRFDGKDDAEVSVPRELPVIGEGDITETFVRGSGPGGQKINKTSNRVVLVHEPTGVRVECQETRSLQQNRKIARRRLREKLDEYLNGSQSRSSLKARRASTKKAKAKARSRARQRRRREESDEEGGDEH